MSAPHGCRELCVGVVIAPGLVPAWIGRCIEALAREPGVRLAAVLQPACPPGPRPLSPRGIAARLARRRSPAFRPVTPAPVVGRVPETADGPALDVVVDLAGCDRPDAGWGSPRLGVWRFEFGPERIGVADAVGLPDVAAQRPTADVRLVAELPGGTRAELRHGAVRTVAHSWARHRDQLVLLGTDWPALACRDELAGRCPPAVAAPPPPDPPGRVPLGRLARSTIVAHVARARRFLREAQWHVGILDAPIDGLLRADELPPPRWLPGPPRRAFYADPFPGPGGRWVIVERFGLRDRIGSLCTLAIDPPGGPPRTVAQPPHHISYPYVVEHEGHLYCVPETAALGEVGLYRLDVEAPRLEKVATLVEGVAALDPTVTLHDGRWWLFFTDAGRDPDAALAVWYADKLRGPWHAHARNPVKVDVRSSRPAGTPFTRDGRLFRPAMDNSESYGGRIVVNRVLALTPDDFAEEVAAVVPPFPGRFGTGIHTVAAAGRFTVVDGKRERAIPSALPARLRAHLARSPAG